MCSVSMYRKFCANLALETGTRVFAVNYRKAPEFPFPCAQLDAFDTAVYLYDNCKALNLDVNRLVFAGDSAGGQLVINCWVRINLIFFNLTLELQWKVSTNFKYFLFCLSTA